MTTGAVLAMISMIYLVAPGASASAQFLPAHERRHHFGAAG